MRFDLLSAVRFDLKSLGSARSELRTLEVRSLDLRKCEVRAKNLGGQVNGSGHLPPAYQCVGDVADDLYGAAELGEDEATMTNHLHRLV